MNNQQPARPDSLLEARLLKAARSFTYPPTPRVAGSAISRRPAARPKIHRLAWVAALVFLLAALLFVSPARARVLEWLRLGAVRLNLVEPALSGLEETRRPDSGLPALAGATSLAEAAAQAPFDLRLPAYPPGIGEPQQVYLQTVQGTPVVIMAWTDPGIPRLALYQIGSGEAFQKQFMQDIQETKVNGEWALWVTGPYLLTTTGGQVEEGRIVTGRTLIWSADGLTFRLETALPLDEARKIAESLQTWR